jgi:hypothetical protein
MGVTMEWDYAVIGRGKWKMFVIKVWIIRYYAACYLLVVRFGVIS